MGSSMSALSCLKDSSTRDKITYDMSPVRSRNLPIVWLIGQKNTGKKTHGELIKETFNFVHINVTDILRNEAKNDSPRGKTVDDLLNNNKKVSDFLVIELLKESLLHANVQNGYVISNFPKSSKQADLFVKEIGNVSFVLYFFCDNASLLVRAQERSVTQINEAFIQRNSAYATRDIKMSLAKFLTKVENVNTSDSPEEVFRNIEDIFVRRLSLNKTNLKTIPEVFGDSRSVDNTREPIERVPQSIINSTPNVDPILDNHDLLKNELQNSNSSSSEVKVVVSHGDNPQGDVIREKEQESDDVEMSNESSDIVFDDGVSKSSSNNNTSMKEENVDSISFADKVPIEIPEVTEEDLAESLYS